MHLHPLTPASGGLTEKVLRSRGSRDRAPGSPRIPEEPPPTGLNARAGLGVGSSSPDAPASAGTRVSAADGGEPGGTRGPASASRALLPGQWLPPPAKCAWNPDLPPGSPTATGSPTCARDRIALQETLRVCTHPEALQCLVLGLAIMQPQNPLYFVCYIYMCVCDMCVCAGIEPLPEIK